ncbi:hypothetical protein ACIBI4_07770 [Streptomyces sp. NPDC050418]|uniref:hypothetical protein n=1 Tax=Streptomyces sp. NPDC050418 TaxID=3365612 RepID=UPI0037BCC0EF
MGTLTEAMASGSTWQLSAEQGGELGGRWWKWALSAPDSKSPVRDTTGEHAAWSQPDDLWFLAGTYGGKVTRTCEVPSGRPLFFPVLNIQHAVSYSDRRPRLPVAHASAHLNGVPLELREFEGRFRYAFKRHLTWGVWGAINPLSPGQYVLEIKADTGKGFWVDTTYHLAAASSR